MGNGSVWQRTERKFPVNGWEYKVDLLKDSGAADMLSLLTRVGEENWELVQVIQNAKIRTFIFKRPKTILAKE